MVNNSSSVSSALIKQTVSQIEHLEEQKSEIATQIKETFDNAKSNGLDVSILKQLIKQRKRKKEDIAEEEELLELYRRALEQ
jgi:uncharacterized protein (UPF0335 family)